jgi:hypothetical protein
MKVIDLDTLRPEPQIVKIGGREIDVSFVPCGITFELDDIVQQLVKLDAKKVQGDREEMRRAFGLGVKLCAIFCEHKYPDMNEAWFLENCQPDQINGFTGAVQAALVRSYQGVGDHAKN